MRKLSLLTLTLLGAVACFSTACSDDDDDTTATTGGTKAGGAAGKSGGTAGKATGGTAAGASAVGGTAGKTGGSGGKTGGTAGTAGKGSGGTSGGVSPAGGTAGGAQAGGTGGTVVGGGVGGKTGGTGGTVVVGGAGGNGGVTPVAGTAGTTAGAGQGGAGGKAAIASWEFPAVAGGAGGASQGLDGWSVTTGAALTQVADSTTGSADGQAAQILVSEIDKANNVQPEFRIDFATPLNAAGATVSIRFRIVTPAASVLGADAVQVFVQSSHWNAEVNNGGAGGVSAGFDSGWLWQSGAWTTLSSITSDGWQVITFALPAAVAGTGADAGKNWDPAELSRLGLQFTNGDTAVNVGGAGGATAAAQVPFTVSIDAIWIQ